MNRYTRFIMNNPQVLVPGTVMTETELCRGFSIARPDFSTMSDRAIIKSSTNFSLRRATAYTGLNKYLRQRGVVIKQKTTGVTTKYYVSTEDQAIRQITDYTRRSGILANCASQLETGHRAAQVVGLYNPYQIPGRR